MEMRVVIAVAALAGGLLLAPAAIEQANAAHGGGGFGGGGFGGGGHFSGGGFVAGPHSLVEVLAADPISAAPVILQAEALILLGLWVDLALLAASGIAAPVPGTADPVLGMRAIGMATITSPTTTFMITSTIAS